MILSDTPMGCGFFIFFTEDPENSGGSGKSVADSWESKGKSATKRVIRKKPATRRYRR